MNSKKLKILTITVISLIFSLTSVAYSISDINPLSTSKDENQTNSEVITILCPEPNEIINRNDVVISFTLKSTDTTIEKKSTKIFLNEIDISTQAVISDDLFTIIPEESKIQQGKNIVKIELYTFNGKLFSKEEWHFFTSYNPTANVETSTWSHKGFVQLESRHENITGSSVPYNRATINAIGSYGDFRFLGRLYLTNEEKGYRQPQNRFFIGAESPWLKLGYGDQNPVFPNLIMNGKRIRGFAGNLYLEFFNLDIATGYTSRSIEGTILEQFPAESLLIIQNRYPTAAFRQGHDTTTWIRYQPGTFSRHLFVIRPSFGKKEVSQLGFTYLKSKDEPTSILYGVRPQENIVIGTDFNLEADKRKIQFSSQAAISASNRDISQGIITDAEIDSLTEIGKSDRDRIKKYKNMLSKFITVNRYLVPLSIKHFPTLSYEAGLGLNYFDNQFRINYIRRGTFFESFGQSALRSDVEGFQLSDRIRLLRNQLGITFGLEQLKDNTAKTKSTTTSYSSFNGAISFYPTIDFPNITLGYYRASTKNPLPDTLVSSLNEVTNRFMAQLSYRYFYLANHISNFNITTSSRDDMTKRDYDAGTTTISFNTTSIYSIPLQTTFGIMTSFTSYTLKTQDTINPRIEQTQNYTTLQIGGNYRLIGNKLYLSGMISPILGANLNRTLFEFGSQYYFYEKLSAQIQTLWYVKKPRNEYIFTLSIRMDV